jgi:hypothetical protein
LTVQVPDVALALSNTFGALTITLKLKPNVEPFKSGVETSVYVAVELFQTAITNPALIYPDPFVITYSKYALEPVDVGNDAIVTFVVLIDEPD